MMLRCLVVVFLLCGCAGSSGAELLVATPPDAASPEVVVDATPVIEADPPTVDAGADVWDGCVPTTHWSGFSTFVDCIPVGQYSEELALDACRSYFTTSAVPCSVMNDGGQGGWCAGETEVGAKSEAWILWSWTADAGFALESTTSPPTCADNGAGKPFVAWW